MSESVDATEAVSEAAASQVVMEVYRPEFAMFRVEDQDVKLDLKACASQAACCAVLRSRHEAGSEEPLLILDEFPGGVETLKDIIRYMQANAAEERAAAAAAGQLGVPAGILKVDPGAFRLAYDTENICNYLEAAALLRCPRLMRDTVLAPAAKELTSRRVLALLERVMQLTMTLVEGNANEEANEEDAAAKEEVHQAFSQVIQRLCARLDAVDFKLTAALAAGTPWASLEVLRAHRIKLENMGRMNYALQSVTSTFQSFFYEEKEDKSQLKQEWKEHHFALHVYRKHIIESALSSPKPASRAAAEAALQEQQECSRWSDDEGDQSVSEAKTESDVPEIICDVVEESTLADLSGFVAYCDPLQTPPVLAAAMVQSVLLKAETERARLLFEAVFVRSRKAQAMVVAGRIPVDFLSSVKMHRVASVVLRRLLARYESLSRADLCHLLDNVLLEDFREEKHCHDLVLNNALVQDITVYCRVSTRSVAQATSDSDAVLQGTSQDTDLLRLRKVGERLFAAVFVLHGGFLPNEEETCPRRGEHWQVAECPWDSGDLDLPLLQHVPLTEDALHLSRRVLLRGLFRRQHADVENDVPTIVRLWALGRWGSCRDAALISEAFSFLCICWRSQRAKKALAVGLEPDIDNCHWIQDEESLFRMFADLQFWRLQLKELLTPWAPPQLLACHVATRCKELDLQQIALLEDNRRNLAEINRLRQAVSLLHNKLEVSDTRSVQNMQKQAEVLEKLRSLR